jgi:type IV pilus assembly protein PilB
MKDNANKILGLHRKEEEKLADAYAKKLGLTHEDLSLVTPESAALEAVKGFDLTAHRIFPYKKQGNEILLAIEHPDQPGNIEILKKLADDKEHIYIPVVVSRSSMDYLLDFHTKHYAALDRGANTEITGLKQDQALTLKDTAGILKALPPTALFDKIFELAVGLNASDIHLEPEEKVLRVRFRLDGNLYDAALLPPENAELIVSRIKLIAGLKLNIKTEAQDGSFETTLENKKYDVRVSIVPAAFGETVVMRLLPQDIKALTLDNLGLVGHSRDIIESVIQKPNGLILNTGPTGSGKTTTLYAILQILNKPNVKIVTLEDPVEYKIEGISQTEIDSEAGYTFADGLRAALRQDPDVILVGEIRDQETAETAINAALTGHLVLSTLHTNDAAGALPRLVELGVKPNLFADSILAVIAQRLVRRLNPEVPAKQAPLTPEWQNLIAPHLAALPVSEKALRLKAATSMFEPGSDDEMQAFKGRIGVYETLTMTPEINELMRSQASISDIRAAAVKAGMVTMQQDGILKALDGTTTLEEVKTIIGL